MNSNKITLIGRTYSTYSVKWMDVIRLCDAQCRLNRSLPMLKLFYCEPLAAIVRRSKVTAVVAKIILLMMIQDDHNGKIISLFNEVLYQSVPIMLRLY